MAIGPKKTQQLQKNIKIEFFTKNFSFAIQVEIWEVWGCPGGGGGPYEDIVSNFGRVWSYMASESPLFTFDSKLEGSFMTKYLQVGFWISPKAKDFWLNGLRRKSFLKNDKKSGKLGNLQKSSWFDKMASLFMPFFEGGPRHPPPPQKKRAKTKIGTLGNLQIQWKWLLL